MSQMDEKINKLLEAVGNMGCSGTATQQVGTRNLPLSTTHKFSTLLPIKNEIEFNEFETMLRDKTLYDQFIAEISTFGGTSGDKKGYKIAYGLIDQLFTREFMTKCSWTGSSKGQVEKINFSVATTFLQAFYDIVHLADSRYSKNEAKDFFKEKILRNANARLLNLQQKESDGPIQKRRRTVKNRTEATVAEPCEIDTSTLATYEYNAPETIISTVEEN